MGKTRRARRDSVAPRIWVVEVWHEIRPTFKALIADFLLFLVVLLLLSLSNLVIHRSELEPSNVGMLERYHFYLLFTVLIILGLALILTLIRQVWKREVPK